MEERSARAADRPADPLRAADAERFVLGDDHRRRCRDDDYCRHQHLRSRHQVSGARLRTRGPAAHQTSADRLEPVGGTAPGDWNIPAREPMTDFTPSPLQARAIRDIRDWFENRTDEQPVFRVWGYAGAGKSTLTKHAIAELGLDTMTRNPDGSADGITGSVLYAAFTGKAVLVMTRKGTPASTIHSLIYRVSEATKEEVERVKEDIAAIRAKLPKMGQRERFLEESRLRSLDLRLDDIHKPRFVLNEQSIVRDARLIVLDEVSMVGAEMAA